MRFCLRSINVWQTARHGISCWRLSFGSQPKGWKPPIVSTWESKRAGAAITLLKQGERGSIFDVFRYTGDPESLSQFVARCRDREVSIQALLECFEVVDTKRGSLGGDRQKVDDSVMYALLLALGEYSADELPKPADTLIQRLAQIYAFDRVSGVHSAAGWLLRQWGQDESVARVDQTPLSYDATGHREWYVQEIEFWPINPGGLLGGKRKLHLTLIVFAPCTFKWVLRRNESSHDYDEPLHQVTLTRPLAVSDRELTWAHWDAYEGEFTRRSYGDQF